MSDINKLQADVIESAQSRIGRPFRHHFKPVDLCNRGQLTVDECFEHGLDDSGYDCSGLIIASIAEAIQLRPHEWNRELRHLRQVIALEEEADPQPADVQVFHPMEDGRSLHVGFLSDSDEVIHATGISKLVERGVVEGKFSRIGTIPLTRLIDSGFINYNRRVGLTS